MVKNDIFLAAKSYSSAGKKSNERYNWILIDDGVE
jgi:hypothetical protein